MRESYDVFLSHTSRDKPAVRRIAEALREANLTVWFDEWELVPGESWQDALEHALSSSKAALIIIGPEGPGPWQNTEMSTALTYAVKERRPVIPVFLPGANSETLPAFLRLYNGVQIRSLDGESFVQTLEQIIWGITGRPPTLPPQDRIPKVFLCHAKEDDGKVRNLYYRLRELGLDPWYDKEKLVVGDRWEQEIVEAIRNTDFFAICLSSRSVAKTGFIQREIRLAVKEYQHRPQQMAYLLPLRLEPCELPRLKLDEQTDLSDLHWIDLFEEEDEALQRFVDGVRTQFRRSQDYNQIA